MMNLAAGFDSVTAPAWTDLADELDAWAAQGKAACLWWRDDDAVEPTPQLDDLIDLAGGVPLGLAVIPAMVRPELREALTGAPQVAVLQHGWRHANHGGGKKSEFPPGRAPRDVAADLAAGRDRLGDLFGDVFVPVLAPPWNRFAAEFEPLLPEAGLIGLSGLARSGGLSATSVATVDVHLDLVAWRGDRGFIGEARALAGLIGELSARRLGVAPDSAIGILTHHLVMDRPAAGFLAEFLDLTRAHDAVRWVGPGALLDARR